MSLRDRIQSTANALLAIALTAVITAAQSTSQDYPTPVTTNEISGTINARDVGDARLTSYYYQFDSSQGDLFLNLVTRNFTGDIDVFTLGGLQPLTKIVVYADLGETETGRVIYLRKPERLLLRVQGRTPGDDPATFRIKFAGSFVASKLQEPPLEPALPTVTAKNESGIRVNSVGTIVEVIPKATPTPAVTDDRAEVAVTERAEDTPKKAESKTEPVTEASESPATKEAPEKKVEVVVTDNVPPPRENPPSASASRSARNRRPRPPRSTPPIETPSEDSSASPAAATETRSRTTRNRTRRTGAQPPSQPAPDPLEKVNLVVLFKDGSKIERPMSEVLRFTVDKGVLTVVAKDGSIGRYSILDVAKVTIE